MHVGTSPVPVFALGSAPYRVLVRVSACSWGVVCAVAVVTGRYTVTNPDPTMHLVDYIRDVALLKGTKVPVCLAHPLCA